MSVEYKYFVTHKAKTEAEREKAALHDPRSYPQDMPCAQCGYRWMQHKGLLCPISEGTVSTLVGTCGHQMIIPPKFGCYLFVPDENYYKEPDFDVS